MKRIAIALSTLFVSAGALAARLPQTVIPAHYAVSIAPDLAAETYRGDETIDVEVKEPVSSITMHAIGLDFRDLQVSGGGKNLRATVSSDAPNAIPTPVACLDVDSLSVDSLDVDYLGVGYPAPRPRPPVAAPGPPIRPPTLPDRPSGRFLPPWRPVSSRRGRSCCPRERCGHRPCWKS